jgi:small subunit ribosomal protein S16
MAQGQEVKIKLDLEKVAEWQAKGAQLSDRVAKLVKDMKAAA